MGREDDWCGQSLLLIRGGLRLRPVFPEVLSYFSYNASLCINGHEWAKRQVGVAFTELDNGLANVEDPAALQAICDRLGRVGRGLDTVAPGLAPVFPSGEEEGYL
jgi:hypothetical protein